MRQNPFTRPTILAAVVMLDVGLSQAKFDHLVLWLSLERHIPSDSSISVSKKAAQLGRLILTRGSDEVQTLDGTVTLTEAAVRQAVALMVNVDSPRTEQARLVRALALDGFVVEWRDEAPNAPVLRAALPAEVDLPAADDEVHRLLKEFAFQTALGHLDQAIEAHTRGDWAAANSQTRTFLESLFEHIAHKIDPAEAAARGSSENRRAWLAEREFLSKPRNEWTNDGKNYLNGLFKMLHTEGSHPGLSDEDRSTFRLHLVLITARTFLRRLKNNQ
ncbi:hypothetical protein HNP55_004570 [Paucibacter oligotrophus]|uniref:Uncharacterized protein n=1 Tax=Roseateles oligotrophus TaxID=1769250 RepID=A0A840LCX4_9BURK|nr:hypothetical protein [Roseateles oligotrophus]MBB4846016.1 hypothetical protein [Roseateles oligotrophus]